MPRLGLVLGETNTLGKGNPNNLKCPYFHRIVTRQANYPKQTVGAKKLLGRPRIQGGMTTRNCHKTLQRAKERRRTFSRP